MHAQPKTVSTTRRQTRYQRALMFFVLVFLALQLIGASQHKHAYTDSQSDCAACVVAHLPAGAPPPVPVVLPVALLISVSVLVPQLYVHLARTNYLTPPSHAPPAVAAVPF